MTARKDLLIILFLIAAILFVPGQVFAKKGFTCFVCNGSINGQHLVLSGQRVHKTCFICKKCQKEISGSYNIEGRDLYHPTCYKEAKGLVCNHCGNVLKNGWVEKDGRKYHETCYRDHLQVRCDICGKLIFGNYKKDDDGKYHGNCFKSHKLEKCVICSLPIEKDRRLDVWGNSSHSDHNGVKPDICGSCGRVITKKTSDGGFVLSDDRIVCGICNITAVVDPLMVEIVSVEVKGILATIGLSIPGDVPVHLVDKKKLAAVAADIYQDKTKGITNSVTKRLGDERVSVTHAVYILSNLPRVEFSGVLIHEYLHVWLNENGIKMSLEEVEGFCNLGYMLSNLHSEEALAGVLQKTIEKDADPVYGDGYRSMKNRLDISGWKALIEEVKQMTD